MLTTHQGNLVLTNALSSATEAVPSNAVIVVNPSAANGASSSISTASIKAISAQFFSPSYIDTSAAAAKSAAAAQSLSNSGAANPQQLLAGGSVSQFDAPMFVTPSDPTTVNQSTDATFYAGGYSVFEKNDHIYDEMLMGGENDEDNDNINQNNSDNEDEEQGARKKKTVSKVNQHLAVVVVKGHRTAVVSPCRKFVYILRTDSFALDWAVDISALLIKGGDKSSSADASSSSSSSSLSVKQLVLLDAHRIVIVLSNGRLFYAARPISAEASTIFNDEDEDNAADGDDDAAAIKKKNAKKIFDNNVLRKPAADKFRYFLTKDLVKVAVNVSGVENANDILFSSLLPLKMAHVSLKKQQKTNSKAAIVIEFAAVARFARGAETTFSAVLGNMEIGVTEDGKKTVSFTTTTPVDTTPAGKSGKSAAAPTAGSFDINTPSAPTGGFTMCVPTVVEQQQQQGSSKANTGGKKAGAAAGLPDFTVLIVPVGVVTTSSASVVGCLVALSSSAAGSKKIVSVTEVKASSSSLKTTAAAELLNENMLTIGVVSTTTTATKQNNSFGRLIYGTFYYGDADRSTGATVDACMINLGDEEVRASTASSSASSSAASSSSFNLIPVGLSYNVRLSQQTVVTISSQSSASSFSVKLCSISLLTGAPTNGSTIANGSWVAVNSVIGGGGSDASADEEDRFTGGGKSTTTDTKCFVTVNYPIVTLTDANAEQQKNANNNNAAAKKKNKKGAAAADDATAEKDATAVSTTTTTTAATTTASNTKNDDPYRLQNAFVYGRCAITAPMNIQKKSLAQWPNAVIGVLKLLVDYTCVSIASSAAAADKNGSSSSSLSSGSITSSILGVFKRLSEVAGNLLAVGGGKGGAAAASAAASAFDVSIITHSFHPSAIRNALRRLPFAVTAATIRLQNSNKVNVNDTRTPLADRQNAAAINAAVVATNTISTNDLINSLFAALLDGVDASSASLITADKLQSNAKTNTNTTASLALAFFADSFLRSAVGALDVCHHLITLQGQLGATIQPVLISRYVLLLRALRSLGDESDQIAGRLGATLDRQRMASARSGAQLSEKEQIKVYQAAKKKEKEGGNNADVEAAGDAQSNNNNATNATRQQQQRVDFTKADIRHKVTAVGTGSVADCLSAQLNAHKKVLDLVDDKIAKKLEERSKKAAAAAAAAQKNSKNKNNAAAAPVAVTAPPLYATAGMRSLKSDFQDHYERYLLLGGADRK